jgi:quinol monooxygenase YgiN
VNLVLARMSKWIFEDSKREEGFFKIDEVLNKMVRHTTGFRGYMSPLSQDEPNSAVILTLWQDQDTLDASEKGVFTQTTQGIQNLLEKPPTTSSFRVFSTELFQQHEKTE